MTNDVGLTYSVGNTIPHFTISIEQHNQNIIFSVVASQKGILARLAM